MVIKQVPCNKYGMHLLGQSQIHRPLKSLTDGCPQKHTHISGLSLKRRIQVDIGYMQKLKSHLTASFFMF
jgi:hypothetical protein